MLRDKKKQTPEGEKWSLVQIFIVKLGEFLKTTILIFLSQKKH